MTAASNILNDMNDRTREVFRRVVEAYLSSGDPVGSRTLTRTFSEKLSAATIRNVMQDLEYVGLLGSPHTSAGRIWACACSWIPCWRLARFPMPTAR
jgi:heat-inducible transcriptional repressor